MWVYALVAAVIVLLGAGGWSWFHGSNESQGGEQQAGQNRQQGATSGPQRGGGRIPVQVAEVKKIDLPVYLNGLGNVQAYNTVVVRTRIDGEIQQIGYQEGQIVTQGDLLVQIDPRPYQAALDQAVAKKRQDEATLASNRLDLERTRQLAKNSYASQQQLDQQTANVSSLTAQVAIDQAAIENAQTQLSYTTIRAPISGRTGLRLVDRGNIVHSTDTTGLVEITQIQPIAAIFTAPETQLPLLSKAIKSGPVEVAALTSDGKTILDIGRLELLNNSVDPTSGTVRLKAVFPNGNDQLWPGQSVNTRLLQSTLRDALAVPAEAVQRGQDQLYTYVIDPDGKADKRTIEVSLFGEGHAVVANGLLAGEKVVTSGQYRLTAGAQTEIRPSQGRDQNAGQESGQKDRTADATRQGSAGPGSK